MSLVSPTRLFHSTSYSTSTSPNMPPKRKRTDDVSGTEASTSTRATRSAARNSSAKSVTASMASKASKPSMPGGTEGPTEHMHAVKKARTKVKAATPRATKGQDKQSKDATTSIDSSSIQIADVKESGVESNRKTHDGELEDSKTSQPQRTHFHGPSPTTALIPQAVAPPPSQQGFPRPNNEPYAPQTSLILFSSYTDSDEPDVIGPEGFERLCTDANFPLDGPLPLILAWQLAAKEMAKITKDEWVSGMSSLKVSSLFSLALAIRDIEQVLILNKPVPRRTARKEPYDKTSYWAYCDNIKMAFQKLYTFCFVLAKPEQSRNIEMETAVALWSVLLVPKYPIMAEVLGFITERSTYKAANKDLWSMMLEFCETVNPNLSDYEGEGAWPTLLDDFVAWKTGPLAAD